MRTTAPRWSYKAGERGRNRVRAYEEKPGGMILVEFYECEPGATEVRRKRVSLGHNDRKKAKRQVDRMAASFGCDQQPDSGDITLGTLFDNYIREVTPSKSPSKQLHDRACAEMFLRFFGSERKARILNRRNWDAFVRVRRQGAIAPRGSRSQRGVRARQVEYDLKFLVAVLNWATSSRLLEVNPLRGFPYPREESPRRTVASQVQYEALLNVAPSVEWRFELALVLAHETGHRIGAIRKLRWSDIDLERGLVRWRADNDKIGYEHETPISDLAIRALRKARREASAIGDAWVFPSPDDQKRCCSRHIMRDWWGRARKQAELAAERGLGWHSLRRKFATELKDTPLKDLCELGGWKDHNTILKCYQRPDEATMREALERRKAL